MLRAKTILITLFVIFAASSSQIVANPVGVDVGLNYSSDYFWRGFSFYGTNSVDDTRGVFFPWIGFGSGDFYLYIGGEVAEALIADDATETEKDWNGIDFILTWSKPLLDEWITPGLKLSYFYYPRSRGDYGTGKANDFAEVAPSITFSKLPLSPKILVSWYYRIKEQYEGQETAKDIYVHLSMGHSFAFSEMTSLYLGAWGAYFNYASQRLDNSDRDSRTRKGFSDVGLTAKLTAKASSSISFDASYNYAYTPDKDFYTFTNTGKADRHHHWTTFGVTYSL